MRRNQAEKIAEALMSEQRSALAIAAEKKRARDRGTLVQQWIGAGALVGLAIGSVVGLLVNTDWYVAGFIGLGCGSLLGRLLCTRLT